MSSEPIPDEVLREIVETGIYPCESDPSHADLARDLLALRAAIAPILKVCEMDDQAFSSWTHSTFPAFGDGSEPQGFNAAVDRLRALLPKERV